MGKHPVEAVGFGGRQRRLTGDQYDFFSIDFDFGNGVFSHSFSRQIDGCANQLGEHIVGTEGYTNCKNTIYNPDGSVKWTKVLKDFWKSFEVALDKAKEEMKNLKKTKIPTGINCGKCDAFILTNDSIRIRAY